jgi:transcriptional regulator GlxA family with amidase domain
MKIAFVLYDGVTLLDFAGMYDPVTRLKTMGFVKDLDYTVCARKEQIRSFEGVGIVPDTVSSDLSSYDYVMVPGGNGIQELIKDKEFLGWIQTSSDNAILAAVCGGALLIGAAGYLRNKRATTNPMLRGVLKHFACDVSADRIVRDGNIVTAGGVTAAIDLGLYICENIAGRDVREKIQTQMDYTKYPEQ